MTNEELVLRIQAGERDQMAALWDQVKLYAYKRACVFYYGHTNRCIELNIEVNDLKQEAYLGVYQAAQKYRAEYGVKFLTYAEYHLKNAFFSAAKLKNTGYRYREVKLEDLKAVNADGDTREYTLPDLRAADEIGEFIQQEQQGEIEVALSAALGCISVPHRNAVYHCVGRNLTYAEYARQNGVSRQRAHQLVKRGLEILRSNENRSDSLRSIVFA